MSNKKIIDEINKVLENIPDNILEDILEYLKTTIDKSKNEITLTSNLRRILNEDKELLERLAR